jgi:methionyl-tRNA formyltransferase
MHRAERSSVARMTTDARSTSEAIRVVLCGDRALAVSALRMLLDAPGTEVVGLAVSAADRASHADELRALVGPAATVLVGDELRSDEGSARLAELQPDVILSVHFPYLVPQAVLDLPTIGAYNLHPALLPHGRGWHTVSWALLESTPVGCTLHRMTAELDRGPIVAQREVEPTALETAHALYQRVLAAEGELLAELWPEVRRWPELERPQPEGGPPARSARELLAHPDRDLTGRDHWATDELVRALRAFTTSDPSEAMWVDVDGERWIVRLERHEEPTGDAP